ncbi:MAG TPA: TetR/AcrR family transcriptional regulator [Planococcus sp. (in: firmicutes)]|nr:TetR/AcrR family transcriptional regulator [Planococcus sp. (in: firmicutes)]
MVSRQQQAQLTRKKILNAAMELFNENGFDDVRVIDIADKSKTSKGAFYTHFNSKYEIFLEKFKEIDEFYLAFEKQNAAIDSPALFLERLHIAQARYLRDELGKDSVRTIYMNLLRPSEQNFVSDPNRPYFQIVKRQIEKGQHMGNFRTDLPAESLSSQWAKAIRGNVYDWCGHDIFDIEEELKLLMSILLAGIKA